MDWIEHQFSTSLSTIKLNSQNSNKNLQMNRRVLFLQMVMFVSMLAAVAGSPQDGGEGDELHQRQRRFIIAKKFLGGVGPGGKSKGEDAAPAAIPVVGIIQRPVAVPVPIPMEQPYYPAPAPYQPPAPQYAPQPQYAPPPPQYAPPQQYAPAPQQYAPPPQQYAPPPQQYAPPPMPYQAPAPYQAPMPYQAPSPYTPQAPPAY